VWIKPSGFTGYTALSLKIYNFILGASGRINNRMRPDRALRLYLLPDTPERAKGYRFNPLRLCWLLDALVTEPEVRFVKFHPQSAI
jgi:hypothetical protein